MINKIFNNLPGEIIKFTVSGDHSKLIAVNENCFDQVAINDSGEFAYKKNWNEYMKNINNK
ncbi:MAG: hypothetical protein V4717_13895 [Bacteroidota bacterium]